MRPGGERSDLLLRQAAAEFLGSAGLVAVVLGSGIAAQRLSPDDSGLQLLENALATGAGLVALILAVGPVSGGHFNPVITLAGRILGGVGNRQGAVYLPAQLDVADDVVVPQEGTSGTEPRPPVPQESA